MAEGNAPKVGDKIYQNQNNSAESRCQQTRTNHKNIKNTRPPTQWVTTSTDSHRIIKIPLARPPRGLE